MEVSFGPVVNTIILIVLLAAVFVVMYFVLRKHLPTIFTALKGMPRGPRLAELEVEPGAVFELTYKTQQAKEHRLFLAYQASTTTGSSYDLGMTVTLDGYVDGEHLLHEKVGKGYGLEGSVDRLVTVDYYSRSMSFGSTFKKKATMPLTQFAPRPAGTELVVKGVVELNQHTEASKLILFIC